MFGPATIEPIPNSATITLDPVKHPVTILQERPKRWLLAASLAATALLAIGISVGRSTRSIELNSASNQSSQIAQVDSSSMGNVFNPVFNPVSEPASKPSPESDSNLWGKPVGELTFASDDSPDHFRQTDPLKQDELSSSITNPRIPIYEVRAEQAQRWISEETQRTKTWREELRRRGYELDTRPQRIEKQLPDGRALIIPVNQWNVRPWGQ